MYKVIIIDDEEATRKGLIDEILWEKIGLKVVGQAVNGEDGVNKVMELRPDIALLDVKMPRMNGIECAHSIRKELPECKIIFMSGYSDKEYLKSAIQLKAIDYIEKPINLFELETVLTNTVKLCIDEEDVKQIEQNLRYSVKQSEFYIKQEIALELIHRHFDLDKIGKTLCSINLSMNFFDYFICSTIKLNIHKIEKFGQEQHVKKEEVLQIIYTELGKCQFQNIAGFMDNYNIVIHSYGKNLANSFYVKSALQNIQWQINEYFECEEMTTVAMGNIVRGIENLSKSYHASRNAMSMLFVLGYNKIIEYEERAVSVSYSNMNIDIQFIELLNSNKISEAIAFLIRFSKDIKGFKGVDINTLKKMYMNLIIKLFEYFKSSTICTAATTREAELKWLSFLNTHTMDELNGFIINEINSIYEIKCDINGKSIKVKKAIQYIIDNYADDIQIEVIADFVNLSPNYLSNVFKKEMGITLNQYIEGYRINKAKGLLKNFDLKLNDICQQVGYNNTAYFISVFKKVTGLSPTEFRRRG